MRTFLLRFWAFTMIASASAGDNTQPAPEIFAPEIISTDLDESCGSFSPDGQTFILCGAVHTQLHRRFPSSAFPNCVPANGLIPKSHRFPELISMRRFASHLTANGYSFLQSDQRNRIRTAVIGTSGLSIRSKVIGAIRGNSASRSTRPRTIQTRQSQRMEQCILPLIATVHPGIPHLPRASNERKIRAAGETWP